MQVQCQMFCTKMNKSDKVVFTWHDTDGFCIIPVKRNENFIQEMVSKATVFFQFAVIPELISGKIEMDIITMYTKKVLDDIVCKVSKQKNISSSGFLCFECGLIWDNDSHSIQCEKCEQWFHLQCAGLRGSDAVCIKPDLKWFCKECTSSCNSKVKTKTAKESLMF